MSSEWIVGGRRISLILLSDFCKAFRVALERCQRSLKNTMGTSPPQR